MGGVHSSGGIQRRQAHVRMMTLTFLSLRIQRSCISLMLAVAHPHGDKRIDACVYFAP